MRRDKRTGTLRGLITVMFVALVYTLPGHADIETYQFDTPEQEMLYRKLIKELRCTVCQNQDIGDSNADLAKDLRRKTYKMVIDGKDEQFVLDYMSQRYGDFVLYRPRVQGNTLFLWAGPFLILLATIILLFRYIRRTNVETPFTEEDRNKAEKLLEIDKE